MSALRQAASFSLHLQEFMLRDVVPTGRTLGAGSFGSVMEVSL